MAKNSLPLQPYKGARDFYPQDMRIRNYIFNKWSNIARKYGYEEYEGPFIESFEIYAAKSGEELVNEQMYWFLDRGERKVAIRPEATPTLARMVAQKYNELTFPVRWFSIPNLWRYEKPQKGRLREHFQLNVDIFGIQGIEAELEILSTLVDIMLGVGAKQGMFEIRINNRRLMQEVYEHLGISQSNGLIVNKALDKKPKITDKEYMTILQEEAQLTSNQITGLEEFLTHSLDFMQKLPSEGRGVKEIKDLLSKIHKLNLNSYIKYEPTIMRGLDYYTGTVFELFDLTPENTRAMCGGGRYDDLVEMFNGQKLPGVGYGMGDVTFKNFLENWNLLPAFESETEYLVTLWPTQEEVEKNLQISLETAKALREKGKKVQVWLEKGTKLDKQLKFADKKGIRFAIIIGENELKKGEVTIKDLKEQKQETKSLESFISNIK